MPTRRSTYGGHDDEGSAQDTINQLHSNGYKVIVNKFGGAVGSVHGDLDPSRA